MLSELEDVEESDYLMCVQPGDEQTLLMNVGDSQSPAMNQGYNAVNTAHSSLQHRSVRHCFTLISI